MPRKPPKKRKERKRPVEPEPPLGTIDYFHYKARRLSEKYTKLYNQAVTELKAAKKSRNITAQREAYHKMISALMKRRNAFRRLRAMCKQHNLLDDVEALTKFVDATTAYIKVLKEDLGKLYGWQ